MAESKHSESKEEVKSSESVSVKNISAMLAKSALNRALGAALASRTGGDVVRKLYPFYASHIMHGLDEFYSKYLDVFDVPGEENRLEWTGIHHKYEAMLEGYLNDFCDMEKIDAADLYNDLAVAQESGDKQAKVLIKLILAQADFLQFVDLMKSRVVSVKSGAKGKHVDEEGKSAHK